MQAYEVYIFNNTGNCLFYEGKSVRDPTSHQHNVQLMFGLIYSLKSFSKKFSKDAISINSFKSYVTKSYKLHILETYTGLNFILLTEPNLPDQTQKLQHIYADLFSPLVLRNPFYEPMQPIRSSGFRQKIKELIDSTLR